MNTGQRVIINIIIINILMMVFGLILEQNPFSSLSIYLSVFGACLVVGTILTLPLYPIKVSASSIIIALLMFSLFITIEYIHPSPPTKKATQAEMGNTPQAEWQFQLFYKKHGSQTSIVLSFNGNTSESEIYLKKTIEKWNEDHPNSPIISYIKSLSYIPYEYAKKNGYPLSYSRGY